MIDAVADSLAKYLVVDGGVAEDRAKELAYWLSSAIQNAASIGVDYDKPDDKTFEYTADAVSPRLGGVYAAVRDMIRAVQETDA